MTGLWRSADFLKLWAGQAISQMGSWITLVGLPLLAAQTLHASPFQMGVLSGVGAAAMLLFGLFAGAWADRLRRRPILIWSDLGRAAIVGAVPLAAVCGRLSMNLLFVVAAASALFSVFFDVSYQAYLPSLVSSENLLEANSKLTVSESVAGIAGPGITGALIAALTAPIAILFDAISFLISAAAVSLIRKPEPAPVPSGAPHILREISEGLTASWRDPILRALLIRDAVSSIFLGFGGSLYILFALRELHLGAALLGAVISVGGFSGLFGALAAERLARHIGAGWSLIGAALLTGIANLLPPLARGPLPVCAAILAIAQLGDMAFTVYHINQVTLRQAITPPHLLGRVNSAAHLMFRGVLPIGALAGGAIAEWIGLRGAMFAGASGVLLSTLVLIASPVRKLRELPKAAAIA